jgi:hypothetical protein
MKRAVVPWIAILLVLLLSNAAQTAPSTVVLAVEGMT